MAMRERYVEQTRTAGPEMEVALFLSLTCLKEEFDQ
jgi:hypothetical protein